MRVLRLDLQAYGPFTQKSLEFGNANGLSIVCGPNEAGKSSALRAFRALLCGIPGPTVDNFVHASQDLRIGGVVEAADGTRMEIVRRKGKTKSLRGPDDATALDESTLLALLGGIGDEAFRQRFGIDHRELRRGGELLASGGGDLSEILFLAGGIPELRAIQRQLEKESEELFKPQGSKQRIHQSVTELKAVRKEINSAQLSTSRWREHDEALRRAERSQQEIVEKLAVKHRERHYFERVYMSLPLASQLGPIRKELNDLSTAVLLPDTFSADRRQAEVSLHHATERATKTLLDIESIERQLQQVDIPLGLLQHRTWIDQLQADLGSYQKAAKDLPHLVSERDAASRRAAALRAELGAPWRLDDAESCRLTKVQRSRIRELASECKALAEREKSGKEAVESLEDTVRRSQQRLEQMAPTRDASDLERTLRRVQKLGDLDGQQLAARAELDRVRAQAEVDLASLPLFAGGWNELEMLPVPAAETLERFESQLAAAEVTVCRCADRVQEMAADQLELRGKLDSLQLEREVPSEADLDQVRRRRDIGWRLLRQSRENDASCDAAAAASFIEEFAAGGELLDAFRASVDRADLVADRLRREADRVAERAQLTVSLQQAERKVADARIQHVEAERQRDQLATEWRVQWTPSGVAPLSPREMRGWRERQQKLAAVAAEIRNRAADVQRRAEQIDSARCELSQCLDFLDQGPLPSDESLATALDHCQQIGDQIRNANQRRRQLAEELDRQGGQRSEARRRADEARNRLDAWRTDWAAAVAAISLDGNASPTEASSVIENVDELLNLREELRKLEERINGIDEDAKAFDRSLRQLLEQIAPDLVGGLAKSTPRAVVEVLVDRLQRATRDQASVDGWQKQLQNLRSAQDEATSLVSQWRRTQLKFCEQANCSTPDDLPAAEERSSTRRRLQSEVLSLDRRLLELAAGQPLDAWIAELEQYSSDDAEARRRQMDNVIQQLEQQKMQASEEVGKHRNELSRMDGGGLAADAQIQAEHLLASIRNDAGSYVRLCLAREVLKRAMERFRESSQGPVLERASELFASLTLHSFAGLRADYDDNGKAMLVGVRADGRSVAMHGMSEGTCDQMYLALRLALLEASLVDREPLPFVLDDILVMFDDSRTVAALKTLTQLAKKTQVILFTHHEHVVDIARSSLDSNLVHVCAI